MFRNKIDINQLETEKADDIHMLRKEESLSSHLSFNVKKIN